MSEHAELIHTLDQEYSLRETVFTPMSERAIICPNEGKPARLPQSGHVSKDHGIMQVHASGHFVVCGRCGEQAAIGMQ